MTKLFADRYELKGRLGVGGMATVELAFDTRLERHVAVKLLADHLAQDPAFLSRFKREALSAARLVHPNVVQVFDFGTDSESGRHFIVMEHVDGRSCSEILREGGWLDASEAAHILNQACRGLQYAHQNGVIHRDVKPGNLLVSNDGVVKLADFGIAKAAEQSDITKIGSVLGTAAYLSPEQTRGEPAAASSDLYALGVVAYQLLTGRLPYESNSLPQLARLQEIGNPISPNELNPSIPVALSDAVMHSLAGNPQDRFADAKEMGRALADGARGIASVPNYSSGSATVAMVGGQYDAPTQHAYRGGDHTAMTSVSSPVTPTRLHVPAPAKKKRRNQPSVRGHDASRKPARSTRRRAPQQQQQLQKPPKRRRRWRVRLFMFCVFLAVLAGIGMAAFRLTTDAAQETVRIKDNIVGTVDQAVEAVKEVIGENTQ